MTYKKYRLEDICEFIKNGKSVQQTKDQKGLPITRIETIANSVIDPAKVGYANLALEGNESYLLKNGDILFSHINSVEHLFKTAKYDGIPEQLIHGMNLLCLRPNVKLINPQFFLHLLRSDNVKRGLLTYANKSVNQASISATSVKNFEVNIPSLEEQRRIASILDKADDIRQKRQQAIAKLDEFLQATFIDMFGDPVSNPKKLKLRKLSEVGNISTGNTPSRADEDNYGNFIEWIKSDNLNHGFDIATQATEYLSEKGKQKGRIVPSGSILVTCIAGSLSCIGNLAIVDREVTFNQQINSITPNENIQTEYLYYLLKVSKPIIQSFSTNSMKGMISKSTFSQIELPIAPSEQQTKFVNIFNKFFDLKNKANKELSELDNLFNALQQKAFNGTL